MKKLSQNKAFQIASLLTGSFLMVIGFQNCSPTQFSAAAAPSLAAKNECVD
jgi:hypothetical protein